MLQRLVDGNRVSIDSRLLVLYIQSFTKYVNRAWYRVAIPVMHLGSVE